VGSKRKTVAMLVRLPPDVKVWLEREATRNAGSQNSEIVRSVRLSMKGKRARTKGDQV
jgi:hypothetical protein